MDATAGAPESAPENTRKTSREIPEINASIAATGDVLIVLKGLSAAPQTPLGLRVSSHALSLASPIFASRLSLPAIISATPTDKPVDTRSSDAAASSHAFQLKLLPCPEDDSDTMFLLAAILHLRHDLLPARVTPVMLRRLAALAHRYKCVVAVGRPTIQWFDQLFNAPATNPVDTWSVVEAAFLLDEPLFFARFSSKWVLDQPLASRLVPATAEPELERLALILSDRRQQALLGLHGDVAGLVEACAYVLSKQCEHFIDWPPGAKSVPSDADDRERVTCRVDADAASVCLGALRDAGIWPSQTWSAGDGEDGVECGRIDSITGVIERIKAFRPPEADDEDRCAGCDGFSARFETELSELRDRQRCRLWGMCLDCYCASGDHAGECRFEHPAWW